MIDEEPVEIEEFVSDDGRHLVSWDYWHYEGVEVAIPAWVCRTHNKLYYIDCVFDAQTD